MDRAANEKWWKGLVVAIRHWMEPEFRSLLAQGGDVDRPPPAPYELPLLCEAARIGAVPFIESLLAAGADINHRDHRGLTPLHWAAKMGHLDAARVLLRHGAMPNLAATDGGVALYWVAIHCQRPSDPRQKAPDPDWLDFGMAMLEAGANGDVEMGGVSALDDCPALRASWERKLLKLPTDGREFPTRPIRRP